MTSSGWADKTPTVLPSLILCAALGTVTGNPIGDFQAGVAAAQAGDDPGAEALLRKAEGEAPGWPLPDIELAQLALRSGRGSAAQALAKRATDLDPQKPRAWHLLSLASEAAGDLPAAEAADRQAVALRPDYQEARQHLADVLWNEGKRGPAIDLYLELTAAHPEDLALLATVATAEEADGRVAAAEQALRVLIESQPKVAAWHRRLGRLLQGEGRDAAASREFALADRLAGERRTMRRLRPLLPSRR